MDSQYSLSFSLRIIRARNIFLKSSKELFVRCYLPIGSTKRVKLDSQEISSDSDLIWNQTFSLDCFANQTSIQSLKKGAIVFELRYRNHTLCTAKKSGSKLLARAEMAWKDVVETKNMEIEKWVVMSRKRRCKDDMKPAAVQIGMNVVEYSIDEMIGRKNVDDSCGCVDCNYSPSCVGYEFFALETAFELAIL